MAPRNCYDPSQLATVTVTFNPDIAQLRTQLKALPIESLKYVVDNASQRESLLAVRRLVENTPNARLICIDENLGLAAAINRGAQAARTTSVKIRFLLLLDQDSQPMAGSIEALVKGFLALQETCASIGCVGPNLIDVNTGLLHGFHQCTRWRWKRVYRGQNAVHPVPCANLNGSGTLVPADLFFNLGGLEEQFFIDHVDTEWAFRVQAKGYKLFGIPNAVFRHSMGEGSLRFWFLGRRVWPLRSPSRHYFLYRNAVALMRRNYVPPVWKAWASIKLGLTFASQVILGPQRLKHTSKMLRGIRDGIRLDGANRDLSKT